MSPRRFSQRVANLFPVPARTALVALAIFIGLAVLASLVLLGPVSAPVTAAPAVTDSALDLSGVTLAITGTTTTVARTTGSDPSTYGDTLTFRATVKRVDTGTALTSGTVTFKDNGVNIPSCVSKGLGSGYAQCSTGALTGGEHTITAHYSGSGNFGSSIGILSSNQTVNKANINSIEVQLSDDTPVYGQEITIRAEVDPDDATGIVFFDDNGTEIGRAVLVDVGSVARAEFKTFRLAAGEHRIRAVYHGDINYEEKQSAPKDVTVRKANTKIDPFVSSPSPSEYGQYVTFTATVTETESEVLSANATIPTGFVTFELNPHDTADPPVFGQGTLNGAGEASFTTAELAAGDYDIYVTYQGDANYNGKRKDDEDHKVNKAETEIEFTGCPGSSYYGESVTFEVRVKRVTAGLGTPTGKVEFEWHVHENEDFEATLGFTESSEVSFANTKPHDVGDNQEVKAKYQGDDNFKASECTSGDCDGDWAVCKHDVDKARTTTELQDPVNPTDYGQDAQFMISVKRHEDEPGFGIPTGTVTLDIDPGPPGSIAEELPEGSSVVTIVTNTLRPDDHDIKAEYGGDDNFKDSDSDPVIHTVNKTDSETTLESSVNPSAFGQSVTFTATVEAAGLGFNAPITPTGTVAFKDGGAAISGCGAVPLTSPATCTTSDLSAGTHEITAEYSGDTSFKPSEDSLRQTVNTIATTTELSGPTSSAIGDSVTFTATVSETLSGDPVTDGDVTFYDGMTELATVALNGSGQATYNTSSFSAGLHPLKAVYNGTANFQQSTSQRLNHRVTAAGSNTTLTVPASSVFGEAVTFTANVTAGGAPVTSGQVTFYDGATTLGSDTLDASGEATLSTSTLAAGAHTIKARFGGNADYGPSEDTKSYTVNQADTTTSITSDDPDSSVVGQPVLVEFTVGAVSPGSGNPTGDVTVSDGTGATCVGSVGSAGSCTLIPTTAGSKTLTATYAGDTNFNGSSDNTQTHQVNPADTTTTVTSSPPSSLPADPVIITANVTADPPGGGTPTGNVTFKDGAATIAGCSGVLLSGGSATCNTTALVALGAHTLWAYYANIDGNFNNSSDSTTHNVSDIPADLSVTKTDSPDPVNVGDNLTYIINVTNHGPESTDVTLTDTLPPQGTFVSATPSQGSCPTKPNVGDPGGTVTCNLLTFNKDDSATVTIVVNVPIATPAGTVLRNTAQVSGTRPEPAPDPHPNTSTQETTVYRSPRRGDCNGDDAVNLADVWAIVRDIFDPTFQGTTGCDANKDRQVDAGDVPSTVLIMLNSPDAGGLGGDLGTVVEEGPALALPDQVPAVPGGLVTLPVSFAAHGHSITSLAFSVDYDETWLALDPTDRDGNGIPDAVVFSLPGDFTYSVTFDEGDADGEVDVFIGDISPPLTSLSDGPIAFMILNVDNSPGGTQRAVRFSLDPSASFGDTSGQSVPGTATPGGEHRIYLPVLH